MGAGTRSKVQSSSCPGGKAEGTGPVSSSFSSGQIELLGEQAGGSQKQQETACSAITQLRVTQQSTETPVRNINPFCEKSKLQISFFPKCCFDILCPNRALNEVNKD